MNHRAIYRARRRHFLLTNFANNVAVTVTMMTIAMTMATQANFNLIFHNSLFGYSPYGSYFILFFAALTISLILS